MFKFIYIIVIGNVDKWITHKIILLAVENTEFFKM